jgi:hypothetical protein
LKEQMKDYEDTRKKFNAGKQEIRQERSVIVTSPGGNHGAPPAAPAAKSKSNEDWRNKEADLLMGRYGVEKEEAPPPAAKSTQAPAKKGKAPAKKEEEVVEDDFIIGPADPSAIQIIRTKPQPQQPPPIQPQQGAQQPQQQAQPAKPPPATPPPPPPPPPPKPKEPTAEDILKKQKGHFDEGSGQFVDDELMEETGKKKKK